LKTQCLLFPGSGLSAAKEPRRDRCLTITDGHLVIAVLFEGGPLFVSLRKRARTGDPTRYSPVNKANG